MNTKHRYRRAFLALLLLLTAACNSPVENDPDVPGDPGDGGTTPNPTYRALVRS